MVEDRARSPTLSTASLTTVRLESIESKRCVSLRFFGRLGLIAEGVLQLNTPFRFARRDTDSGVQLTLSTHTDTVGWRRVWWLRAAPLSGASGFVLLERNGLSGSRFALTFSAEKLHSHRGLKLISELPEHANLRLGAFTQHGQLFNLKDWLLAEKDGVCSGLLAARVGTWTPAARNVLQVRGENSAVHVTLSEGGQRKFQRNLILVQAPASEALHLKREGIVYFEPPDGYPVWPARLLARHGFARPERLEHYRKAGAIVHPDKCGYFAFGEIADIPSTLERCRQNPALAANHPFWKGDFERAKARAFEILRRQLNAIADAGMLHPLGNPVAMRNVAPSIVVWHMLDCLGKLTPEERREGRALISSLAELHLRRDFYAHHIATLPADSPASYESIYRGMLNQNFNTERYVTVAIAGCVLRDHPRSAYWRRHGVEQFRQQMQAFVYPSGAWEESYTYANQVKLCLLPMTAALRRAPEQVDLLADERFKAMCRFFVQLLSPRGACNAGDVRRIPAIGDHGYYKEPFSYLFGWLATLCPAERDMYLWAWRESGAELGHDHHEQIQLYCPLFLPDASSAETAAMPEIPALRHLPGYGVVIRRDAGSVHESLLVVRCGESWGHSHPDQGSFWWYCNGHLICAEADLGMGIKKHEHSGHNVLGYLNRTPLQFFDKTPFHVDRAEMNGSRATIRCQVPTVGWQRGWQVFESVPENDRPHHTRTFVWENREELVIRDLPRRSPEAKVTWSLHVLAEDATQEAPLRIRFNLRSRRGSMLLELPTVPGEVVIERSGHTTGVRLQYPEMPLTHRLTYQQ
jgi:hypothetical protein